MNRVRFVIAATVAFAVLPLRAGTLTPGEPLEVRVLYDNSGSMYPGYEPPGSSERRTRSDLGVGYFHESPRFVDWLGEFAARQTVVDGKSIGMWTCTSEHDFLPSDIQQVHPVVPLGSFSAGAAVSRFPARTGTYTYLTEAVEAFTRDFTGLLWLITDNIVETTAGEPDAGVQAFFGTLAARREIRAVHLFKYSFEERGQTAAIAVYGVLVSPAEVPPATLEYYDGKFRLLRDAKRSDDHQDLFSGREYLKLKDLRVKPLNPELRLVLSEGDNGSFKEGQTVQLDVDGAIRSYLTQHTVTGGHYELAMASPFAPEAWAVRNLGAGSLATDLFDTYEGELDGPIPPAGSRAVKATLRSQQPVAFSPRGAAAWLRLAWSGATVRYNGAVRMSFTNVRVKLEPQRVAGIFGIDHATRAFAFQDVKTLPAVTPASVPVSFVLRTGHSRTTLLLALLGVIAALALAATAILTRKRTFRIALSREPERLIALRPLGGHDVVVDGHVVGRLACGLGNYSFRPLTTDAAISVTRAKEDDAWDVRVAGTARRLTIKAEGGAKAKPDKAVPVNLRAAPPPPPPRSAPPPVPGRPPRAGRN